MNKGSTASAQLKYHPIDAHRGPPSSLSNPNRSALDARRYFFRSTDRYPPTISGEHSGAGPSQGPELSDGRGDQRRAERLAELDLARDLVGREVARAVVDD